MWWDRLFKQHGKIAWDDYEKDYSDLPEEVLEKHRWALATGCGRSWPDPLRSARGPLCLVPKRSVSC